MGTNRLEELLHLFNERAPIARFFGMRLTFTEQLNAVIDLPYNPMLDHSLGGVHCGVYATMLDSSGWFTAAASQDISCWLATSEMTVHFLEPVKQTSLHSTGRLLKRGRHQLVTEMHLYDGRDRLVGHATGTFLILEGIPIRETASS